MQPAHDGTRDFDFLFGTWRVAHNKLRQRHAGSSDWDSFNGTAETRPLLGGIGNVEENHMPGDGASGIALRTFDLKRGRWSIYWMSSRDGLLQPPVVGRFEGGTGRFEGEDIDEGRPIRARFLWHPLTRDTCHWEQAFSLDSGATWETNWTMDFIRLAD
ncbi:MAG: hypothetical protein V4574_15390 [Pseudomonadota bacterium]